MITHLQYYNLGLGFQLLHLQVLELSLTPDKTKWIKSHFVNKPNNLTIKPI